MIHASGNEVKDTQFFVAVVKAHRKWFALGYVIIVAAAAATLLHPSWLPLTEAYSRLPPPLWLSGPLLVAAVLCQLAVSRALRRPEARFGRWLSASGVIVGLATCALCVWLALGEWFDRFGTFGTMRTYDLDYRGIWWSRWFPSLELPRPGRDLPVFLGGVAAACIAAARARRRDPASWHVHLWLKLAFYAAITAALSVSVHSIVRTRALGSPLSVASWSASVLSVSVLIWSLGPAFAAVSRAPALRSEDSPPAPISGGDSAIASCRNLCIALLVLGAFSVDSLVSTLGNYRLVVEARAAVATVLAVRLFNATTLRRQWAELCNPANAPLVKPGPDIPPHATETANLVSVFNNFEHVSGFGRVSLETGWTVQDVAECRSQRSDRIAPFRLIVTNYAASIIDDGASWRIVFATVLRVTNDDRLDRAPRDATSRRPRGRVLLGGVYGDDTLRRLAKRLGIEATDSGDGRPLPIRVVEILKEHPLPDNATVWLVFLQHVAAESLKKLAVRVGVALEDSRDSVDIYTLLEADLLRKKLEIPGTNFSLGPTSLPPVLVATMLFTLLVIRTRLRRAAADPETKEPWFVLDASGPLEQAGAAGYVLALACSTWLGLCAWIGASAGLGFAHGSVSEPWPDALLALAVLVGFVVGGRLSLDVTESILLLRARYRVSQSIGRGRSPVSEESASVVHDPGLD